MNAPLFIVNLNWSINIYAWLGILGFLLFYFFRGTKVSCATVFISQLCSKLRDRVPHDDSLPCMVLSTQSSHCIYLPCRDTVSHDAAVDFLCCVQCMVTFSFASCKRLLCSIHTCHAGTQSRMMRQYIIYFRTCRVTFSLHHTLYTSLSSMRAMQGRSLA